MNHVKLHFNITHIFNDPNTDFPDILINQDTIIPTNSIKYLGISFKGMAHDAHLSMYRDSK